MGKEFDNHINDEDVQDNILRLQKAKEIYERVLNENHTPKQGQITYSEQVEGWSAIILHQLTLTEIQEKANAPKKEKKKLAKIHTPEGLDKLHKSTNKPHRLPLQRKILATQESDAHPVQHGYNSKIVQGIPALTNMNKKEFSDYTKDLLDAWNKMDEEERINFLLENAELSDKRMSWKYRK